MATKVHMEALSPTMEEGQLVRWLKNEGDAVKEGDVLAEIETDKATMELVARGSGVLQGVALKEGQTAPVGQVIAVIAAEGETVDAAPAAQEQPKAEAAAAAAPAAGRGSEQSGRPEGQEQLTPAAEETGSRATAEGAEPSEARAEPAAEAGGNGRSD